MAVRIRLRRIGKRPKKRPHFRITVADGHNGRDSRFIEEIGFYNPLSGVIKLDQERLDFWVKNGAQPTQAIKKLIRKIKTQRH